MKWELVKEKMHSDPRKTCYRIRQDGVTADTIYDLDDDEHAKRKFQHFIDGYNNKPEAITIATIEQP